VTYRDYNAAHCTRNCAEACDSCITAIESPPRERMSDQWYDDQADRELERRQNPNDL
jgi:hypothetical protein